MMFAGNFAPRGWSFCNGQLLAISSNEALFAILGTTYGGDGRTSFALPDLRSRVPMHFGTGPGLSTRILGQRFGTETNTMTVSQMPHHNHNATFTQTSGVVTGSATLSGTANVTATGTLGVNSESGSADDTNPSSGVLSNGNNENFTSEDPNATYPSDISVTGTADLSSATATLAGTASVTGTVATLPNGGQQSQNNIQPVEVVNFIIALQGTFPSRS